MRTAFLGAILALVATSVRAQSAIVVSDGTATRPHCSWNRAPCIFNSSVEDLCAQGLCSASGYAFGSFISASNNPCTTSFVAGAYYFYLWTTGTVVYRDYFNDARITARCSMASAAPTAPPPTSAGTTRVISDGTATRPHCSWNRTPCIFNSTVEGMCAQGLCAASGYTFGRFVSASNNPCTSSFVTGTYYFYVWTTGIVVYNNYANDAQITADCSGLSFAPTTVPPTTAAPPTVVGAGIRVVSDGTRTRPHCSWNRAPCIFNSSVEALCAQGLCVASGYSFGTFVSASNNPCTSSFVTGEYYFYLWTTGAVEYRNYANDAQITALCSSSSAAPTTPPPSTFSGTITVISAGTATRPHCSWSTGPCVWNSTIQTECAQALCQASGYGFQGTFVRASNNPCTSSYVDETAYFYLWTTDTVVYANYINDAQITSACIPTVSGRVTVISDGTALRPHCSWSSSCVWNTITQLECAQALCFASGYGRQGSFIAASNNPCTSSFVTGTYYFYVMTSGTVVYRNYANDARITASCIASGTAPPTVAPTPAPTQRPTTLAPTIAGTVTVISDGTRTRPHCSWNRAPCVWNASVQLQCAQALCQASGYGFRGSFVSASNNACTTSFVTGTFYFYLWTTGTVVYANYANDAQITARCIALGASTMAPTTTPPTPSPGMVRVVSDGTVSRPHCT